MINDRMCQFCGQDVGPKGPFFTEATDVIPLCEFCQQKIRKYMRMCLNHGKMIVVDVLAYQIMQQSPIKLLDSRFHGHRKSTCLYWPDMK